MSFWINYVGDQIHVCGPHGKIIERFPADTGEDAARARLQGLQGPPAAPPAPKLTNVEAEVLSRARNGIQYRAPALMGAFADCAARGWIVADPTDYGLHITLTAAGMAVAP